MKTALQGPEVFPETTSKEWRKAERHLQALEARRLRDLERGRAKSAAKFLASHGSDPGATCCFTKKPCPMARNCAFSVAEARKMSEGRCMAGRPAMSRWAMCRTAIECNLDTGHCQKCVRGKECNARNGFRLFRCFRLERKKGGGK